MEFLFIKEIINQELFKKIGDVKLKGLFNYYENKINLIEFNNINNEKDDFEFIIDDKNENDNLTEDEEKEKKEYLEKVDEELSRIKKIMEYLVVNIELLKIQIPHFKIYDYSNVSKHIKSKIKSTNHNHPLDIKKFLLKNKISNDDIVEKLKVLIDNNTDEIKLNEFKLMSSFIIITIINIYNYYNKSLEYSKELLKEFPFVIRNKDIKLCKIDNEIINMNNDEIKIKHYGLIKNSYISSNNKIGDFININKNKNKNFEILFK
jgi:hypothetical protein